MALVLERGQGQRQRDAPLDLLGVEVGGGRAVLDPALAVDGPGAVQQRLGQRGLPGAAVADEGDVADLGGREALHGRLAVCSEWSGRQALVRRRLVAWTADVSRLAVLRSSGARMFDGRWRSERRAGPASPSAPASSAPASPPTTSPRSASCMAVACAVAIGSGRLGARPRPAGRLGRCPTCSTAPWPRPRARRRPGAPSSTRSPTGSATPSSSAASPGTWPSTDGGHAAVLPFAVLAASTLISYERAKAESLGFAAKGGLMERAERIIALGFGLLFSVAPGARPVGDARPHPGHRRPAVRQGVAPGQRTGRRRPSPTGRWRPRWRGPAYGVTGSRPQRPRGTRPSGRTAARPQARPAPPPARTRP